MMLYNSTAGFVHLERKLKWSSFISIQFWRVLTRLRKWASSGDGGTSAHKTRVHCKLFTKGNHILLYYKYNTASMVKKSKSFWFVMYYYSTTETEICLVYVYYCWVPAGLACWHAIHRPGISQEQQGTIGREKVVSVITWSSSLRLSSSDSNWRSSLVGTKVSLIVMAKVWGEHGGVEPRLTKISKSFLALRMNFIVILHRGEVYLATDCRLYLILM